MGDIDIATKLNICIIDEWVGGVYIQLVEEICSKQADEVV